ncbi:MAG TPA: fused MFS/spermidine synthase [Chloroflexota bacterium]|nr:fused MFS/spermidine synthase [Chloroflexota bacterium]
MFGSRLLWRSYFIVFVSSACGLILELVAGRMLAPYIGVSLYTWTSIIGIVLAGISLGNYLGGRIADRAPRPQTLGILFFLSGISSLGILALLGFVGGSFVDLPIPLIAKIALTTSVLFFLPSVLIGTISPVVVKLTLKDLEHAGSTVGKIYAWSTAGSILGTFATGFVLISWFGTRAIVAGVAVILMLMGLVFGQMWKRDRVLFTAGMAIIFAGFGLHLNTNNALASPYWKESNYFSIRFYDQADGEPGVEPTNKVRVLVLDHLVHSFVSLNDPTRLDYSYEKVYADITEYLSLTRPAMNAVFIGGGGYTFPRYMEHVYPTSNLEVIEIDPDVTRVNYEELGLSRDTRIVTHNMDGRLFFTSTNAPKGKYDLILGDAFNDLSVPYHLTTLEFSQKVRDSMKPDGFFLINIIDNPKRGAFLRPYVNTLKRVFPHVTVAALGRGWEAQAQNTLVIVASNAPLDPDHVKKTLMDRRGGANPSAEIMREEELVEYMKNGTDMILTDDYAPVDQLIAVLFDERGR